MYKLQYDKDTATLWLWIGGRRYMLVQASGELVAAKGYGLDDYYWSNPPHSCEEIKDILQKISETLIQL